MGSMGSMNAGESAGAAEGSRGGIIGYVCSAKHPTASAFHLLFKLSALLVYLFGTLFTSNYVLIFVVCVLLISFDFWTTKNVTGRLLVGLRWTSKLREDGSSIWLYEATPDTSAISKVDSTIFWGGMWLSPILWVVLLVVGVLKFNVAWLLIVVVALVLNGINLIGFIRCRKGAKKQAEAAMSSLVTQGILAGAMQAPALISSTLFGDDRGTAAGASSAGNQSGGMV